MQQDPKSNKQVRLAGKDIQRKNQFKIVEYYDIKQNYNKMTAEVETYLAMLQEDEQFKEIEDNLVWLLEHQGVTEEQKLNYAARIH